MRPYLANCLLNKEDPFEFGFDLVLIDTHKASPIVKLDHNDVPPYNMTGLY